MAAVLVLLAAAIAGGVYGLTSVYRASSKAIDGDVQRAQSAANLHGLILTARRFEKDAFINLDVPEKHAGYRKKWQTNQADIVAALTELKGMALSDDDRRSVDAISAATQAYAAGFDATLATLDKGLLGTAEDANREFEKYKDAAHAMEAASVEVNDRAVKAVKAMRAPLADQFQHTLALELSLSIVSLVVGAVLSVAVSRSIVRQLGGEPAYAARVARSIAEGDLTLPIHLKDQDQASLLADMAQMQARLRTLVSSIRENSERIATGSSEIAKGNEDLSQRTEEQGANLQQTAASLAQMTSAASENDELAKRAAQLAQGASDVAAKGGEVVGLVVATMDRIAGSSKRIADIIEVIDGIAFQTNILALNAAVEAARAGEQGRGFAVVASEVRNLAKRSADSAKEIRTLIGASVQQVEAGSDHVRAAGATMADIVDRVRGVGGLIERISQASSEQSSGIREVSVAMHQLDAVTQQNAALVEQSAAAAASLHQQTENLVLEVSTFRLQSA